MRRRESNPRPAPAVPTVRIVTAETDDPDTVARVVAALRDVLLGRLR